MYDYGGCAIDSVMECVELLGLHEAHYNNESMFSKLSRIKSDLGGTWSIVFTPGLDTPNVSGTDVNGHPSLSWSGVSGASSYEISVGSGNRWHYLTTTTATSANFPDVDVAEVGGAGPWVTYHVVARGVSNYSQASSTIYFTLESGGSPLSVSMDGPSSIDPNAQCTWTSYASGGVGSYSYQWYLNSQPIQGESGESLSYSGSNAPYTISVRVIDEASHTQTADLYVASQVDAWCN